MGYRTRDVKLNALATWTRIQFTSFYFLSVLEITWFLIKYNLIVKQIIKAMTIFRQDGNCDTIILEPKSTKKILNEYFLNGNGEILSLLFLFGTFKRKENVVRHSERSIVKRSKKNIYIFIYIY